MVTFLGCEGGCLVKLSQNGETCFLAAGMEILRQGTAPFVGAMQKIKLKHLYSSLISERMWLHVLEVFCICSMFAF